MAANSFMLQDGTFAGIVIRVTPNHYASVYDVIRIAGVGSNPYTVWTELVAKVSDFQTATKSSPTATSALGTPPASGRNGDENVPPIDTYKFPGRGQRNRLIKQRS